MSVTRNRKYCPDQDRYNNGAAPGTYIGAVGGWSTLWFDSWLNAVESRATNNTRRWRAMGYLQVAQAVLTHPDWPIEDAVCALRWAVTEYREWAVHGRPRVGDARDAHDIARYLYVEGVTKDGLSYLRGGLPANEERVRRSFARKVLRVAQNDLARWIESVSPMTGGSLQLSTAFRVPGLPLNWRTNPYVPDWPAMPYGFTRPLVALDMAAAGILRFPYTFTKKDPTLRDWPRKDDLIDDIWDGIKDTWEWLADRIDDVTDWICENKDLVAVGSGVIVGGAIAIGSAGAATGAGVAAGQATASATGAGLKAGCSVKAAAALAFEDWDGQIRKIAKRSAQMAVISAPGAALPTLSSIESIIRPFVRDALGRLQAQLEEALSSSPELRRIVTPLLDQFGDALTNKVVADAKRRAATMLNDLRVARAPGQNVDKQIFSDMMAVRRVSGPQSRERDATRLDTNRGRPRNGGYGGIPERTTTPVEHTVVVQNAILAGVPEDAINEALYGAGPSLDALSPTALSTAPLIISRTIEMLRRTGASSPYIVQDEPGALSSARAALRSMREALLKVDVPDLQVTVTSRSSVYKPRGMIPTNPEVDAWLRAQNAATRAAVEAYPSSTSGAEISVRPVAATEAFVAIAREDTAIFIAKVSASANHDPENLAGVYGLRALHLMGRIGARIKAKSDASNNLDAAGERTAAAARTALAARVKAARDRAARNKAKKGGGSALPLLMIAGAAGLYWKFRG